MSTDNSHLEETEPGDAGQQQLRRLVAEYEARLDEVTELVARVRHDINNPLAGLLGNTQLLLRETLSDAARRRVLTIEDLIERIRHIVSELRAVQPLHRPDATHAASDADTPPSN